VLTRVRRYRSLAAGNFVQGASLGVVQLLLGLAGGGLGALLAGFGAARLGWIPALRRPRSEIRGIAVLWRENRRFAALAGSSAFINSLTSSAPVLLVSVFYGDATVGQLAIGIRLLVTPLSIVGQSAASANLGEVSRMLRIGDDGAVRLVRRGIRDLLAVGLIPCALAGVLGAWAVPLVLGQEWREAGLLLVALTPGALAQFVAAPFSQLLNLTGDNRLLLMWDTSRCGATVLSFCAVWAAGLPPIWAVGSWSVALVVLYSALASLVLHAIARHEAR
jgi:O-antigen/teichoic acid export membrane protein